MLSLSPRSSDPLTRILSDPLTKQGSESRFGNGVPLREGNNSTQGTWQLGGKEAGRKVRASVRRALKVMIRDMGFLF